MGRSNGTFKGGWRGRLCANALRLSVGCCLPLCPVSIAKAQSVGTLDQPLVIEVTPPQRAAPSLLPSSVPLPPIQLNLNPALDGSGEFGPDKGAWRKTAWDSDDDGETFRRQNRDKTIQLLLYGVTNTPQSDVQASAMPKVSRNMKRFMDGHFAAIKRDYFHKDDPNVTRLVAGDRSFISETMTRGIAQKPAKLAGVTIPVGKVTFGGGYTWDEKNPTLMQRQKKGLIVGATYQAGKIPLQVSYLTGGRDVAGVSNGGNYAYDNLMFGASIPIGDRWTMNSTLQYRKDDSLMQADQQQTIVTFGTKIRF